MCIKDIKVSCMWNDVDLLPECASVQVDIDEDTEYEEEEELHEGEDGPSWRASCPTLPLALCLSVESHLSLWCR